MHIQSEGEKKEKDWKRIFQQYPPGLWLSCFLHQLVVCGYQKRVLTGLNRSGLAGARTYWTDLSDVW